MNVHLYDGTVRCPGCFGSASYQSETPDPCLYCGAVPLDSEPVTETQSDTEWLNALSCLVTDSPRRAVQFDRIQCNWCSEPAAWMIIQSELITDVTCTDHGQEWFPGLFPPVTVS